MWWFLIYYLIHMICWPISGQQSPKWLSKMQSQLVAEGLGWFTNTRRAEARGKRHPRKRNERCQWRGRADRLVFVHFLCNITHNYHNYHYMSSNLHQQFCIRRWSKAWSHRNKAFALQGTTRYWGNLYSDHHEMLFSRRYRSNAVSTCSDYGKGTIMTSISKIIPIFYCCHM